MCYNRQEEGFFDGSPLDIIDGLRKGKMRKTFLIVASVEAHIFGFHLPVLAYFREKGFDVHIATKFDKRQNFFESQGYLCHPIPFSRSPFAFDNMRALRTLTDLFRSMRFNAIHTHTPAASFLCRWAAQRTKQPYVAYTAHGFHVYQGAPTINRLLYGTLERLAARWTDVLITINREDAEWAKKRLHLKKDGLMVYIPGVGIDLDRYRLSQFNGSEFKKSIGLPENAFVISVVGELNENKNQSMLFESMERLRDTQLLHLILVGEGPMEETYRRRVRERGIGNIHFLGFRDDVPKILAVSDVVALTSKREGLPRCIMEGMAAGKPILGTNIRGIRDLVIDSENGFLVEVGDTAQLAEKIRLLLKDATLRRQMREANLERIKPYALSAVMAALDKVYTQTGLFE